MNIQFKNALIPIYRVRGGEVVSYTTVDELTYYAHIDSFDNLGDGLHLTVDFGKSFGGVQFQTFVPADLTWAGNY